MLLQYKLDGEKVTKQIFISSVTSRELINKWEAAVAKYADELEKGKMRVILHWYNGELKVVTETRMLMKLYCEVYKSLFFKNKNNRETLNQVDLPSLL